MDNNLIQILPHQPVKPVEIERGEYDVVIIEGVKYAGDFFRTMAYPNPEYLYAIRREGDRVWLTTVRNVDEAKRFFEEDSDIPLTPALSLKGEGEEGESNAV